MDKVFIVIVNYTKYKDTIECLESVFKSSYANFQVILVDNSPDDISEINILQWLNGQAPAEIETLYPELVYPLVEKPISHTYYTETDFSKLSTLGNEQLIFIKAKNRGFAAANNVGLKQIANYAGNSAFIWILNNDTVVEKDCLTNLVSFFKSHNTNYIIGSKLRFYHHKQTLQAVAGRYNKWLGSTYHIGEGEADTGQYDDYQFNDDNYIIGASMFLPVDFLNKAGLMREDYFLYYEELDWILTGREHGFKTALQPTAIVYHKEGTSIIGQHGKKKDTSIAEYYSIVNRVKFTKIWYKWCLPTVLLGVVYALVKRLLKGNFKLVKAVFTSLWQVILS